MRHSRNFFKNHFIIDTRGLYFFIILPLAFNKCSIETAVRKVYEPSYTKRIEVLGTFLLSYRHVSHVQNGMKQINHRYIAAENEHLDCSLRNTRFF